MDLQRILFRFSKEGEARFLSHHDLMRLFERALRRAALPLRMTEGFNPHPKLSIPRALPLGVEAEDEVLLVHFRPPVAPREALARLAAQLPAGIRLRSARAVAPGERPRFPSVVLEAELPPDAAADPGAVARLLGRESAVVERATPTGTRAVDIRPAIAWMRLDGRRVAFQLEVGQGATPRPREVLAALLGPGPAGDPALRVRRVRVNLELASRGSTPISRAPDTRKGPPHAT